MTSNIFDFAVIGGGAAGVSAAYELSQHGRVALLEQESAVGYHSTGRSAAVMVESYGPTSWQILASASRPFFEDPPEGFSDHALLRQLGALFLARSDQEDEMEDAARELGRRSVAHEIMPAGSAKELCPVVRLEGFSRALYEPNCADIDANALLGGYLRLARRNGAQILLGTEVDRIARADGSWRIETREQTVKAPILINAAGAWSDEIAARAGLRRLGLTPYRRTAITFDPPDGLDASTWPMTFDVSETWYFKPEAGRVMASPVDKTPSPPCDCAPEELDVAIVVDRIEQATTMTVPRIQSRWAGLRTFAPDGEPVIGADRDEPSFLWLGGQGGNGVMAAPAAAKLVAAVATGQEMPRAIADLGLALEKVSPARLDPLR